MTSFRTIFIFVYNYILIVDNFFSIQQRLSFDFENPPLEEINNRSFREFSIGFSLAHKGGRGLRMIDIAARDVNLHPPRLLTRV